MYNSIVGYALKIIKGNILFSIIIFIAMSQLMTITSIFALMWKYEILLNENIPFFRAFSIYSLLIVLFIVVLLIAIVTIIYIFSKNSRMFSTLRIFGATKLSLKRLSLALSFLYPLISYIISSLEIIIIYIRYRSYILTIINTTEVLNNAFTIFCANVILFLIFMFGAFITNTVLLKRDPYEDLRGTL